MDHDTFTLAKRYVDFDASMQAALKSFHPIAQPHFGPIVDDFYDVIELFPTARAVITGGREQIKRLKLTLTEWLESLLAGPHDAAYLETRARIGRVHVRIGLPQEFMFTATNRIRTRLLEVAFAAYADRPEQHSKVLCAVNQILDIELAIMLATYREFFIDRIRASERLATIGQLAASIGHELRNPLGTIESSLYLMRQRMGRIELDDAVLVKHHDKIANQVKICSKTINNLLDLAREHPPRRTRTHVDAILQLALEHAQLPADVQVIPENLDLAIDADADDLAHVIANLLGNAAQAQGGRGRVHVKARRFKGGTTIRVADEGPGVPAEIRHRIFDALFTTKPRGTGLGLALSRRILYAHGGEIDLEDSPGGAVFRLWVPDRDTPALPAAAAP